jgi:lysophospholipase L1-like esterase
MNNSWKTISPVIVLLFLAVRPPLFPSHPNIQEPDNPAIRYTGRIDFANPQRPRLSNAGAYFQVRFKGTACELLLEDQNLYRRYHNYISVVVDGKYTGRIKVGKDQTQYPIASGLQDTIHSLLVCKASEAQIGYIEFLGMRCGELLPVETVPKRRIEFIGNSITCGTGMENVEVPCSTGDWYDQQNAYLTYGPLIAREFGADWLLSAVSGIGIVRNWNSDGPVMPDVYDHAYLDTTSSPQWDARTFTPDLVSICLGTNDFSDGDGTYKRAPLDSAKFIQSYIRFVKHIRSRYPRAAICCLTSPILSPEKNARLTEYLTTVVRQLKDVEHDGNIHLFAFSQRYNHGCTGHPDREEHKLIAAELSPFFKKVMGW